MPKYQRFILTLVVISASFVPARTDGLATRPRHAYGQLVLGGRQFVLAVMAVVGALISAAPVAAEPAPISGYDVTSTPVSGFGLWQHEYTGTITDTGRRLPETAGCSGASCRVVDETGGSGTLNDGHRDVGIDATHLFYVRSDTNGTVVAPVVTLRLGAPVNVQELTLLGGAFGNAIPEALTGVTVTIGSTSTQFALSAVGSEDVVNLRGTGLDTIETQSVTLSGFSAQLFGFPFDQFSLGEVLVDGVPARISASALCARTHQYVSSSAHYQALPAALRRAIDRLVAAACAHLDAITARLSPAQKAVLVGRYKAAVDALAASGWLTGEQAAELKRLADRV